VIDRIEQAYEDLQAILGEASMAEKMLDSAMVGRLLPPKEECSETTPV